jgi:hypothetical protein
MSILMTKKVHTSIPKVRLLLTEQQHAVAADDRGSIFVIDGNNYKVNK